MPILSNFPGGAGSGSGGLTLAAVSGITTQVSSGKVYVKWTDPDDLVVAGSTIAAWGGTLLVRKAGSAPTSRRDGTIVLDSKTRDAYKNTYFCDSGLSNGTKYYYKFFPYTTANAYTDSTDDEFNAIPTVQVAGITSWNVTGMSASSEAGNGKMTVKWTDPSASISADGVTLASWASTTIVVKSGSYPTSKDDSGAVYTLKVTTRNRYSSTPLTITKKVLLPLYRPEMIYNNGASLEGKGFEFSKRMLKEDLRWHFRRYGRDGNVILIDFKQFFPSVSHEEIFKRHEKLLLNPDIRKIGDDVVNTVSGGVGLPLGVEPSQAEMIAFPSALDNFIKCQLSIKCAGHYMDDYYVIVPPDRDAKEIMALIVAKAESLKLTVSKSKSRIVPLTKPFRYCKAKFILTETGRVVMNGNRDGVKRARRKIKAFRTKIQNGEMSYDDLWTSVNGMLAYFESYDDHNRVLRLRRLFYSVFGFSPERIENFRERGKKDEICCA